MDEYKTSGRKYIWAERPDRSGAEMKAEIELCGITSLDVAQRFDVSKRSAMRWQSETGNPAPTEIWDYTDQQLDDTVARAQEGVDQLKAYIAATGATEVTVRYHSHGVGDEDVERKNAVSRMVASWLMVEGYDVRFEYGNQKPQS